MELELSSRYVRINQWAEEDRPREKLELKGKAALSDAELIAILIGSGTVSESAVDVAKRVLQLVDNNLNELARLSLRDLQKVKGIGKAKAITIVSALELGRRRKEADPVQRPQITCSRDAYEILRPHMLDLAVEEFWLILLNRANRVVRKVRVSEGGVSGTVADPKVIFNVALEHRASALILAHNHPSGNLTPSQADRQLTKRLKDGGHLLEIPVLDHIIFTDHQYLSFADENLL
ncbi:DNA repair protein RadC [Catalinimonas alkaloidigena]|uniref:DNA repair protein RadC n=1 Tax=Catalinimonas alkaloidigena TaxID=1075417 RepID=A0A1G9Q3A2_9BACT|nr:DNA repair protein RadC [Catalinimonas alkaloidigena]SDM05522.1 DNA repair protein RadC [Catalinimonas alkaloidigena]